MRPLRWVIGLVVLGALVGAGIGVWYVLGDRAPAKPKLDTTASTAGGGPATPDGTWKVARSSKVYVGYRMTEVFAGDVVHKTAVGRTPAVSGTLTIEGDRVTETNVSADLRELTSDQSRRDNYIHTHAIESDSFPTAKFTLTKPITLTAPFRKGGVQRLTADGTLTLHGVTRAVSVPLDARWNGPTIEVDASGIPVVLADYGITPPDTGIVKVDDHGSFELALTFTPA